MRLWTIAASLLFAAAAAHSQSAKDANQMYQQGQYSRAADAYRTLLQSDPDNPYLRYNLGNAIYKEASAESLGKSIAEYWRAYRRMPRNSDIRYNFDFVLRKTGDSLVPRDVPATLHYLYYLLSYDELSGLQWIGYWLSLLLAAAYFVAAPLRDRIRPALLWTAIAWAFCGSWWLLRQTTEISNPGVVLEANAEARSGPGMNFPASFNNIPEGTRVTILSERGDWLEIGSPKFGRSGWIAAKAVEKL